MKTTRSFEDRSVVKDLIPGRLRRCGLTRNELTTYWINGLGLWVCPPYASVTAEDDYIGFAWKTFHGKRRRRKMHIQNLDRIKETILLLCTELSEANELFDCHVSRSWLYDPKVRRVPIKALSSNVIYYVGYLPICLEYMHPEQKTRDLLLYKTTTNEPKEKALAEAKARIDTYRKHFYELHTITIEQAIRFEWS